MKSVPSAHKKTPGVWPDRRGFPRENEFNCKVRCSVVRKTAAAVPDVAISCEGLSSSIAKSGKQHDLLPKPRDGQSELWHVRHRQPDGK